MRKRDRFVVTAFLTVMGFAQVVWATPIQSGDRILIDVGTYYTGTTDSLGRTWNSLSCITSAGGTSSTSDLKNTAGVTTDADIVFTAGIIGSGGPPGENTGGLSTSALTDYPSFATQDSQYLLSWEQTSLCLLEDLDSGLVYNITVYGSRASTAGRILHVKINGEDQYYDAGAPAYEGLVTFSNISPDTSGTIQIYMDALSSTAYYAYIGVIDITAIPEPTTLVLLGLGGVSLLRLRRKQ